MSDFNSSDSPEPAPVPVVALIVDPDPEERAMLQRLIGRGRELAIVKADGIAAARLVLKDLESLALFVISVDAEDPESAFALRDDMRAQFGEALEGVFCITEDPGELVERLDQELVFYKPVDDDVLAAWLSERFGPPALEAPEPAVAGAVEAAPPAETMTPASEPVAGAVEEIDPEPVDESGEPAADSGEATSDPDLLAVGTELGDYRIVELLRFDDTIAMYVAEQVSISRQVALKVLHHRHRGDPEKVGAFVDEARSRAMISHADVALVYEADQQEGITYYALELMSGSNLARLAAEGASVDEESLYDVLGSVADILLYLKEADMGVMPVRPEMVHLPDRESCRITNPVVGSGPYALDEAEQMRVLGAGILPFLGRGSFLMPMVQRMGIAGRSDAILTPEALVEALDQLEEAASQEPKTPEQVEARENRRILFIGAGIGGLIVVAGLLFILLSNGDNKNARTFDYMVPIPEGSFVYQDDETVELPQYWIDEYEVTIGQYGAFLDALEADSELEAKVAHADQPETKESHKPKDWDGFYAAAQRDSKFRGADVSLDCPAIQVDWWDAHAYATWRGGRLPTEQEWEKAARSRSGNQFPWGDESDLTKFNSGIDKQANGDTPAGGVDGFRYWCPVDAMPEDESSYGVRGMAGNVSEWTGTWEIDPDFPDSKVPIIRGASFTSEENFELKRRIPAATAGTATLSTGFRTVRDTPPPASTGVESTGEEESGDKG